MIAVIDYGMGNLRSVSKALEKAGAKVAVTSDAGEVSKADAIVLPGVGAFGDAMENIRKSGVMDAICGSVAGGRPFLGICLGLQLLFTESSEGGRIPGLNLLKGKVKKIEPLDGNKLKVPHMGWNQLRRTKESALLAGIPDMSFCYFVHSYFVEPEDKDLTVATTSYGADFSAAVQKDNIFAVQFHPEKSGETGLKILRNFCSQSK